MCRHAHKLLGTHGSISGTETFSPLSKGVSCPHQDRQHHRSGIYKQTRGATFPSFTHASTQTDCVEQFSPAVTESYAYTRDSEPGCGPLIQGKSPLRGLDTPQSSRVSTVDDLWEGRSRSFCIKRERSVPPILFSARPGGHHGDRCLSTRLAPSAPVCFSPVGSDFPNVGQSTGKTSQNDPGCSPLVGQALAIRDNSTAVGAAMGTATAQGSPLPSSWGDISSTPRASGTLGLARERINLTTSGLPPNVVATIQNARASSTRNLYEGKWRVFEEWCAAAGSVAFHCSVPTILSFLQDLLDKGRAFSTIKVYLAAISACHVGFGDKTVGQHPLICRFMRGALRLRPVSKPLAAPWDLASVLEALYCPPFEPLSQLTLKMLSLKLALLLALASTKRVGDIHALSVNPLCMQFSRGDTKVLLKPNPVFTPKVLSSSLSYHPIELYAFYPPPFSSEEQEKLNTLCPVRALRAYVDRTAGIRKSDQLFVSWAKPRVGKPITKHRLSHWIVEAITLAYSSKGLTAPAGLRAHSTRGMAASWALFKGVPMEQICAAASWSSPHTFVKFYKLDVTAPTLAHSVLAVGSAHTLA